MKIRKLNFLKIGILFFGITILLWNCEKEEFGVFDPESNKDIQNLTFKEAIDFFNQNKPKKNRLSSMKSSSLALQPDWENIAHQELIYSEASLVKVDVSVNREGTYNSQLIFININGQIKNVICTSYKDKTDNDGNMIDGRIYFNKTDGTFLDAYKIEEKLFTKRLIPNKKKKVDHAGFFLFLFQEQDEQEQYLCWPVSESLEGIEIYFHRMLNVRGYLSGGGSQSYDDYVNHATGMNTGSAHGSGLTNSQITDAAGAILSSPPIDKGECPIGLKNDFGKCLKNCSEGKKYNKTTKNCECTEGMVENSSGKCVKKPCVGDPVANVEIAPSRLGKKGGTFGCTRKDWEETCGGVKGDKYHSGLDVKAEVNTNTFSMYDGKVSDIRNSFAPGEYKRKSLGNYILVTTKINGETVFIKYNHLNEVHVKIGDRIKAGDIIGLNGNTGNAADDDIIPHIHLQVFNTKWKSINPSDFLTTKFDNEFNPISHDCK